MSIKGIDAQIMITRTPDFARDASTAQKRPEMTQSFLAAQTKMSDAIAQGRVAGTEQSEMEMIRTDVDGGSGNEYEGEGEGKKGKDEKEGEIPQNLRVPPGNNIIDIRV